MNCPKCDALSKKDGKDRNDNQRFKCIGFRPAGLRRTEYLPASACWSIAVKLRVALEQKEKKRGKKNDENDRSRH